MTTPEDISALKEKIERLTARNAELVSKLNNLEKFNFPSDIPFESVNIGISIVSQEGKFLNVNDTLCQWLGYEKEELLNLSFNSITPEEDKVIGLSFLDQIVNGEISNASYEKHYFHKNGQPIWVNISTSFHFNKQNTGYFICFIQNISENKRVEATLKESEKRFREIFDNISDGIFLLEVTEDFHFRYLSINASFLQLTGIDPKDMLGKTTEEIVPKETAKLVNAKYRRCVEAGEPYIEEIELELPVGKRYLYSSLIPMRNEEGRVYRIVGVTHDITQRKEYEAKLKQSETKLRELNQMKDRLFSIVAHDLRSPFSAIMGLAEILHINMDNLDTRVMKDFVKLLNQSTNNYYNLLENLLGWSVLQKNEIILEKEDIQLNKVVSEISAQLMLNINKKGIHLKSKIPDSAHVASDTNMLAIALRNLIANAIKFTPKDGTITLSAKEDKDFVEITVADTGVGIPPENMAKLFRLDTSFSTEGTNREKGTGLGLILCKEFIEKNGGKIWVESEPGEGSRFIFTLPKR
jgi:PAS domain S-box-containing protein